MCLFVGMDEGDADCKVSSELLVHFGNRGEEVLHQAIIGHLYVRHKMKHALRKGGQV